MSHRTLFFASALVALLAVRSRAAEPDVVRIPIECEDMQGVKWGPEGFTPAWTAGRWGRDLHQNMIFGGVWASRMAAAVTDGGTEKAEVFQDVTVPRAGHYKIWAKYECPPFFSYPFGIRIQPLAANGTPGAATFDKVYGLRKSPKHFSFNDKLITGDLYWNWGMDHDAAEGYEADLAQGRYRVTLSKAAGPPGEPVGARSVDVILITSLISQISAPGYPRFPMSDDLQQANHLYLRFKNTGNQPIVVKYDHWNHRANYYYTLDPRLAALVRFYDASGKVILDEKGAPLSAPRGQWLKPLAAGESSPWIDFGPTVTTENSCPFTASAAPASDPAKPQGNLPFTLDLALEPRDAAIVKSFPKLDADPQIALLIQPDLHRPEGKDWTMRVNEIHRRVNKELESYPRVGPIPKKLRLYGTLSSGFSDVAASPTRSDVAPMLDYAIALGLNTLPFAANDTPMVDAAAAYYSSKGAPLIELSGKHHHTQDLAIIQKQYSDPKSKSRLYYNSYGDEIGLPSMNITDVKMLADFRAFLQANGVKPADLNVKSLDEVKPLSAFSAAVAIQIGVLPKATGAAATLPEGDAGKFLRRLYWYSNQFAVAKGMQDFAAKTQAMTQYMGPNFKTTANLGGMHPFYWMNQASFIESFRAGAMTLAWSEDYDYCQPETSRLVADFESAYLRAGAKYHDTPMMFYCMPHYPGNTGQHLIQNAVILWGQGIKDLDFFNAGIDAFSTENYIHSRGGPAETGRGIRQISGMAGNIEDALLPARTRQARIAVLLSEASDIWETGGQGQGIIAPGTKFSNVSQEERKNIWDCLRNHGYLVDLLTENDVAEGRLKDYKVLYVCGFNLDRRDVQPIRQWVEAGGRMFLTAGAARRDQFDEPLVDLDATIGRGPADSKAVFYGGPLRARLELLQLSALDHVSLAGGGTFGYDVFGSREVVSKGDGGQVIGTYKDGSAAMLRKETGKGAVYYTGTLPGEAYARKALMPARPMGKGGPESNFSQWEPVEYDANAARAILLPLAGLEPEAATNHRSVVTNVLDSKTATLVTVVNLAKSVDGKAKDVEIKLPGLAKPKSVRTALVKPVKVESGNGFSTVKLSELDDADVIVIER